MINTDQDQTETDPYAPRHKASQIAARAHRERQDAEEAPVVSTPRRIAPLVAGIVGVLSVVGVIVLAFSQYSVSRPLMKEQPTAIPTNAAFAPPVVLTATIVPTPPIAMVSAYAAPDGLLLGQIELTRQITPVAHYGSDWIQADVVGSGKVWLRRSDVPDLALIGPDLAPVAQSQVLTTRNEWTPPAPAATPEPAMPAVAPIVVDAPLKIRAEDDCDAEHGRCDPPCTAEHGRCTAGDK